MRWNFRSPWLATAVVAFAAAAPGLAQDAPEAFVGVYDGSQTEVAAALLLGDDGRFEYVLSYGAIDEMAVGAWTVEAGEVVLDSDPVTAPAFALAEVSGGSGSHRSFDVMIEVPQGLPVQLFSATVLTSDGSAHPADFREERLRFELERGRTVTVLWLEFPLYQVSSGRIEVPPETSSMRFRFEPNDLGRVAFNRQVLQRDGEALVLEQYDRVLSFRK